MYKIVLLHTYVSGLQAKLQKTTVCMLYCNRTTTFIHAVILIYDGLTENSLPSQNTEHKKQEKVTFTKH